MIDLKNKKVLVTGGAGFVGSNMVVMLLEMGAHVTILDNLFTGSLNQVPEHENVSFVEGDVNDQQIVDELVASHPYIIHAAAKNIIASTKNPHEDFETNIGGSLNLLLSAKKHGIEKLVYCSSASIYGNPDRLPIGENSTIYTLSPYAVSKLAGENYCTAFYESYGLPTSIIRYSNVYGINQSPSNPYCGVVAKFFHCAMNNENIKIHGNGEQTRDFTFSEDAARATITALIHPRSSGMIFNTGTGSEYTINALAEKIIAISGSKSSVEHVDKRDIDNIHRRVMNIEAIRRILRWTPQHTLNTGLEKTYDWLKNN